MKNLVLLFLILSGCQKEAAKSIGHPADFSVYAEKLNRDLLEAGLQPIDMSGAEFYSFELNDTPIYDGYCSKDSDGKMKISLLSDHGSFSNYTYYTFVHEIGHCFLSLGHDEEPRNIMNRNPNMGGYDDFLYKDRRLNQLKKMMGRK